jgi:hypothetical protein
MGNQTKKESQISDIYNINSPTLSKPKFTNRFKKKKKEEKFFLIV